MTMDFYSQVSHNKKMTYVLFLMFFLLIGFLSFILSFILDAYMGIGFIFVFSIFGIISIVFAIVSYYNSDKIVVAFSGAKEISKNENSMIHNIVEELSLASGMPKPKIFFINDNAINAFATGRDPEHAVVCFTKGCLTRLNRDQIQGVAAHELAHIKNYDVRTMTLATVLVGIAVLLSDFLFRMFLYGSFSGNSNSKNSGQIAAVAIVVAIVLAILTPVIAKMITFAISRSREFSADATAVEFTRNPEGLASALEVIANDNQILVSANNATSHLYISNPLAKKKSFMSSWFSTHPPVQDRISALRGIKV